jgi:hypothetical protein
MGKFKDFLNESYVSSAISRVEKVIKKYNREFDSLNSKGEIVVHLPDGTKKLTTEDNKLIKACIAVADGKMLLVNSYVGYGPINQNKIKFIFPSKLINVKKCFHVAERKYVLSILKNGLIPSLPHKHSNVFDYKGTFQTYKSSFCFIKLKKATGIINMFKFKDPVILEIDADGIEFYKDPLMKEWYSSILTFQKIPGNKIKQPTYDANQLTCHGVECY